MPIISLQPQLITVHVSGVPSWLGLTPFLPSKEVTGMVVMSQSGPEGEGGSEELSSHSCFWTSTLRRQGLTLGLVQKYVVQVGGGWVLGPTCDGSQVLLNLSSCEILLLLLPPLTLWYPPWFLPLFDVCDSKQLPASLSKVTRWIE